MISKIQEIVEFLQKNPGYFKKGKEYLASKLDCTVEEVHEARVAIRELLAPEYSEHVVDNISTNRNILEKNGFEEFIEMVGIDREEIKSVKHWQTQGGDSRYSVVTQPKPISFDELYERLNTTLSTLSPKFITPKEVNIQRGLFIYTSDKHIGANVPSNSIYENEWDEKVLMEKMELLLEEIFKQYKVYGRFDTLYFMDLGDALDGQDGFTTRRNHRLPQNMSNEEAFDVYVRVHKYFFDALIELDFANSISFHAIAEDNHSGFMGYSANRTLCEYLNAKYPDIKTKIQTKFIDHISYGYHSIILTHGKDSEDLKHGFPLNLNDKTESFINDYIYMNGLQGYISFVKGDLHQASTQLGKRFRYKNVMSMFGASKWSQNNFGSSKSGVCLEVIEKNAPRVMETNLIF